MIETFTLITISVLLLIYFRPGKTEPLDNPLTINRVGQFNALLAPRLNLAQAFLAGISSRLSAQDRARGDSHTLYFEVRDPEIFSDKSRIYLLAATLADGTLYFQATWPLEHEEHLTTLLNLSRAHHPAVHVPQPNCDSLLLAAMRASAQAHHINLGELSCLPNEN